MLQWIDNMDSKASERAETTAALPCFYSGSLLAKVVLMIYIYALIDPDTAEIRYIGKTIRPKERLQNQCNEQSNTYRTHWIQSVLARGKKPIQIILATLPDNSQWQDVEKEWIAHGRAQGWPLTNCTDGGDGVTNLSGDSKERMLKTWKGRKHKPESIIKIGSASKGRIPSPETLAKRSASLKGRVFTEGHSERLSESMRKITQEDYQEIKRLISEGMMLKDIASLYNIHRDTVTKIKRGTYFDRSTSKSANGIASKYIGVTYIAKSGKWRARIAQNGKMISLGHYESEESAYKAIRDHRRVSNDQES